MAKGLKFKIEALDKTQKAFSSVQNRIHKIDKGVGGLNKRMKGIGAAVGIAFGAASIKKAIDFGDKINKLSLRLGIAEESLTRMKFVAEQSGVSFETLSMSMQRMTRRVAEAAQGSGEAVGALQELGLSANDLNLMTPEQQLYAVTKAMEGVELQGDKVRLAMKLFDTEGVALVQTMALGEQGMRNLAKEADALGATMSGPQAKAMADINDAFNRLSTAFMGAVTDITSALAPAIVFITDKFTKLFQALQKGNEYIDKLGLGFVYLAEKLGMVEEGTADIAADIVFEKMNDDVKKVNKNLDATINRIEKINKGSVKKQTNSTVEKLVEQGDKLPWLKDELQGIETQANKTANVFEKSFGDALSGLESDFSNWKDVAKSAISSVAQQLITKGLSSAFGGGGGGFGAPGAGFAQAAASSGPFGQIGNQALDALFNGGMNKGAAYAAGGLIPGFLNSKGGLKGIFGKVGTSLLTGGFGGFMADGGVFKAGQTMVVGERGPEVITAQSSGKVIPNEKLGGDVKVVMNVYTNDANSFRQSKSQIETSLAMSVRNSQRNM